MIRVFRLFCKFNSKHISAVDIFNAYMKNFNLSSHKCPSCGANHPEWKKHASYERYLISFERGTVTYQATIVRYKCSSCGHTHAILPECIIPYQSYSLLFILAVLKDYFSGVVTVQDISGKYDISVTTLYTWKKLFLKQKKIWLGLLEDAYTLFPEFLDSIFTGKHDLEEFFILAGVSFLQRHSSPKKSHFVQVRSP